MQLVAIEPFSKMIRLSVIALRFSDEIDLLCPAHVDAAGAGCLAALAAVGPV